MLIADTANRELLRSAWGGILALLVLSLAVAMIAVSGLGLSPWYVGKMLAVLGVGAVFVLQGLPTHHPFPSVGPANVATGTRAAMIALLAALVGERVNLPAQNVALATGTLAAVLDGVDGWLARRSNMSSRFGARFDMETDALFILVLAVLAWQLDKAGSWVLASGALRYAFVLASLGVPWLAAPLFPSFRRKAVAVVQTVALLIVIAPFVPRTVSSWIAGAALVILALSFLIDIAWLKREAARNTAAEAT